MTMQEYICQNKWKRKSGFAAGRISISYYNYKWLGHYESVGFGNIECNYFGQW
jgi:hypothetical protein